MSLQQRFTHYTFLACAVLIVAACANLKEPAQQAITGIESAVTAASTEAAKYVPDQLADVQAKLGELKASFDKQDYKAVVAGAPAVLTAAQGLAAAAAAKKDEVMKALNGDWTQLATSVPQLVAAVQTRVVALAKMKKVPAGVDLTAAKASIDEAVATWSKAQAAFSAGNMEEAVTAAKDVKTKAEAAATALKMDVSGGAATAATPPAK